MGWAGYGIYDGDGTQTLHYDFLKWAGCAQNDDEIYDGDWLTLNRTKIPKERRHLLKVNLNKVLKKMPSVKFWNEDKAIEWQMLLALFLDNKIEPPSVVKRNGILGTEFLMEEHSSEFDSPGSRRRVLRNFIKKAKSV